MTDAREGGKEAIIPPDRIATLTENVHAMQLQLALLNERLPAHIESTATKLEEHDTRLGNHGSRLYDREKEAIELRAKIAEALRLIAEERAAREAASAAAERRRTPWTGIIAAVASIIGALGTVVTLLIVYAAVAPALAALK
ncbi:hypothetical protein ACFWGP_05310 [Agromyces sp. NPDC127015]|uniref:hypothetical protein n=1 Tax=Agromyces sp. NPDC127015 TaxID=3347108 RepID=UPI00364BC757